MADGYREDSSSHPALSVSPCNGHVIQYRQYSHLLTGGTQTAFPALFYFVMSFFVVVYDTNDVCIRQVTRFMAFFVSFSIAFDHVISVGHRHKQMRILETLAQWINDHWCTPKYTQESNLICILESTQIHTHTNIHTRTHTHTKTYIYIYIYNTRKNKGKLTVFFHSFPQQSSLFNIICILDIKIQTFSYFDCDFFRRLSSSLLW